MKNKLVLFIFTLIIFFNFINLSMAATEPTIKNQYVYSKKPMTYAAVNKRYTCWVSHRPAKLQFSPTDIVLKDLQTGKERIVANYDVVEDVGFPVMNEKYAAWTVSKYTKGVFDSKIVLYDLTKQKIIRQITSKDLFKNKKANFDFSRISMDEKFIVWVHKYSISKGREKGNIYAYDLNKKLFKVVTQLSPQILKEAYYPRIIHGYVSWPDYQDGKSLIKIKNLTNHFQKSIFVPAKATEMATNGHIIVWREGKYGELNNVLKFLDLKTENKTDIAFATWGYTFLPDGVAYCYRNNSGEDTIHYFSFTTNQDLKISTPEYSSKIDPYSNGNKIVWIESSSKLGETKQRIAVTEVVGK